MYTQLGLNKTHLSSDPAAMRLSGHVEPTQGRVESQQHMESRELRAVYRLSPGSINLETTIPLPYPAAQRLVNIVWS
jgi:hypothetical protein